MKQPRLLLAAAMAMLLTVFCGCSHKSSDEALQLMNAAYKVKDYNRLMALADSLEKTGDLLPSTANYWRGYACDRMKQKQEAITYWNASMEEAVKSTADEEVDNYVKSASRLANLLCIDGDYEGTLKMALPVVERLEELKCDSTSDYINLLIYIGLSQVGSGQSGEEAQMGFSRACAKHRQNIDRKHSDGAYKDAIAGLVNIAYYCVLAKEYEPALYYTKNFGELLIEYEQRPGVDSAYVDRQVGRFTIYKALAIDRLGNKDEAGKTYEAFLNTKFSQSSEGQRLAAEYQSGQLEVSEQSDSLDI